MSKRPLFLRVDPVTAFRRSLVTAWKRQDPKERAEKWLNDVGGAIIGGAVGFAATRELITGGVAAFAGAMLIALWQRRNLFGDALRGVPQAREQLRAEKIRPFVESCERELARYRAAETSREWLARYGTPLVTFSPLDERAAADIRTTLERLREPMELATGRAHGLLNVHGPRLMQEQTGRVQWGEWVSPHVLERADMLKAARDLFNNTLDGDDDARLAFFTLYVCYRNSVRLIDKVAMPYPQMHEGGMYTGLVESNSELASRLSEALAPRAFEEMRTRLKDTLGDMGF